MALQFFIQADQKVTPKNGIRLVLNFPKIQNQK